MTESELALLKKLQESGILDSEHILQQIEMNENQKILEEHPYKIWQGDDGIWKTYLPDPVKGRVFKKRKTKEGIEEVVIAFYRTLEASKVVRFQEEYERWIDRQIRVGVSNNTINRLRSDYRKFIQDTPFEYMDITCIDDTCISELLNNSIERCHASFDGVKMTYNQIANVFNQAIRDKLVLANPCDYVDIQLYKRHCYDHTRSQTKRLFTENELVKLLTTIRNDMAEQPTYMPNYAVELAIYTGMRVGELAGLKWEDVDYDHNILTIKRSEKYDSKTKVFYIDATKNGKERYIPLTEEILDLFARIKLLREDYNITSDFIFANQNEKCHPRNVTDCCIRRCSQAGFEPKSIHSIRRTINSLMRKQGVAGSVAASLLGHSVQVNESNYTYDVSSLDEKATAISLANSRVSSIAVQDEKRDTQKVS